MNRPTCKHLIAHADQSNPRTGAMQFPGGDILSKDKQRNIVADSQRLARTGSRTHALVLVIDYECRPWFLVYFNLRRKKAPPSTMTSMPETAANLCKL